MAGLAAGAPRGRRVWVDLFAARQWPGNVADLDFVGVIRRCKALVLVAQALSAVAALDWDDCSQYRAEVPEEARRVGAFMRVWCLVSRSPSLSLLAPVCLSPLGGRGAVCYVRSLLTAAFVRCGRKQVELMAARDNKIPVVMRCGAAERDASAGGHRFVDDFSSEYSLLINPMLSSARVTRTNNT